MLEAEYFFSYLLQDVFVFTTLPGLSIKIILGRKNFPNIFEKGKQ